MAYLLRRFGNIQSEQSFDHLPHVKSQIALFEITDNNGGSFFLKPISGVRKSKYSYVMPSSLLVIIVSYIL